MKKIMTLAFFALALVISATITTTVSAFPWKPFNNRFLSWQEDIDVIHIFEFDDAGTTGHPAIEVPRGRPILVGFELSEATVADLQANYLDNPDHDVLISIDGHPLLSFKDWYQTPFVATPGSGPAWSWDHDKDGLGDGDGDGIGDWEGPVLFFRYQHPGNHEPGVHTFEFNLTNDGGSTIYASDTVTIIVE